MRLPCCWTICPSRRFLRWTGRSSSATHSRASAIFSRATPSHVFFRQSFLGWIDRQRLERAVWNLLSNTVKFTPKGGTITAELEYTFSAAVLRIHDSGEGVSPAQLTTAFQGYDRICALGDPRWGAGLGLPLAEHIVRLHGGTLMLHTSEGKGTTAVLSLSLSVPGTAELQFHSPTASIDYTGGYAHELVELSDVLPLSEFDSCRIN